MTSGLLLDYCHVGKPTRGIGEGTAPLACSLVLSREVPLHKTPHIFCKVSSVERL